MSKIKLVSVLGRSFLLFGKVPFGAKSFISFNEHSGNASNLYLSLNKSYLLKVQRYKYNCNNDFLKWFFRDFINKFIFLRWDARREVKGYKIVKSLGLKTPRLYFFGTSISLIDNIVSLMAIEYKQDFVSGFFYLESLPDEKKKVLLKI